MEAEFRYNVKAVLNVVFEEKAKLKDKTNMKLLKNWKACKARGEPLTEKDVEILNSLISEYSWLLEKAIAPH